MIGTRSMSFSCLVLVYIASLYCIRADFEIKQDVIKKSTPGDCNQFFLVCRGLCVYGFSAKCATSYDRSFEKLFNNEGCSCLCKTNSNVIPTPIQITTTPTTSTNAFIQNLLKYHNYYRNLHRVPPLTLSQDLNKKAQEWAVYLANIGNVFHRQGDNSGENIYRASSSVGAPSGEDAVTKWYEEIKDWDFNKASGKTANAMTGHFTQVKK